MDESLIREQEAQLQKTGRYYRHICFMAVPVLCMACFLYGVRPLLLCGIAVLTGNLCDRLVSLLRRRVYQAGDFSNESFALVIALLMPVTVDIYVLIIAVLAGVLIGKEIFGGYGSYPFNPAAVGYVVAAVSWPEQVFRYPQPYTSIPLWDASMVPVSSTIEDTLRSGGMLNIRSLVLSLGEYAAPMGTGAALVILACGLFLWTQKDAHMSASVSFLLTCALIAFLFPRQAGLADSAVLANVLPLSLIHICRGHELLPAEAGLHAHHQHKVQLVKIGCQRLRGGAGLDGQAHLAAQRPDCIDGGLDIILTLLSLIHI